MTLLGVAALLCPVLSGALAAGLGAVYVLRDHVRKSR